LFNTLNNLYSLTQKQSDQAPEIVLKLTGLLHYMLYECNAPEVYLTKETAVIQDYMELERLRYGKRLTIRTHIAGDLEQKKIAPLLLIPFVENAFKHGAAEQISQACIELQLVVKENNLFFELVNSQNATETNLTNHHRGGIGLKNVKKRLDLIYPDQYDLTIDSQKEKFIVVLKIALN
jgi:LytS/YehU family sensor histidine kinase